MVLTSWWIQGIHLADVRRVGGNWKGITISFVPEETVVEVESILKRIILEADSWLASLPDDFPDPRPDLPQKASATPRAAISHTGYSSQPTHF